MHCWQLTLCHGKPRVRPPSLTFLVELTRRLIVVTDAPLTPPLHGPRGHVKPPVGPDKPRLDPCLCGLSPSRSARKGGFSSTAGDGATAGGGTRSAATAVGGNRRGHCGDGPYVDLPGAGRRSPHAAPLAATAAPRAPRGSPTPTRRRQRWPRGASVGGWGRRQPRPPAPRRCQRGARPRGRARRVRWAWRALVPAGGGAGVAFPCRPRSPPRGRSGGGGGGGAPAGGAAPPLARRVAAAAVARAAARAGACGCAAGVPARAMRSEMGRGGAGRARCRGLCLARARWGGGPWSVAPWCACLANKRDRGVCFASMSRPSRWLQQNVSRLCALPQRTAASAGASSELSICRSPAFLSPALALPGGLSSPFRGRSVLAMRMALYVYALVGCCLRHLFPQR